MSDRQKAWLSHVVGKIFESETRQFQKQIDELIEQNSKLLGFPTLGFQFRAKHYGVNGFNYRGMDNLNPSLHSIMGRLVQYWYTVENDKAVITQVLGKIVLPCQDEVQLRNELPECIIALVPDWLPGPRTAEPAQNVKGNPRDVRQFQKVLLKIEAYCAMRFLC